MEIKRKFDKEQIKQIWKKTEFFKTATLGSFKKSNKTNISEINNFNNTLSRLGLDVADGGNVNVKKNYMSPQIILKMYKEKIAEREKSRKDKEKRLRKLLREEDKMIELNKAKGKKVFIVAKDKDKFLSGKKRSLSNEVILEEDAVIDDPETYQKKMGDYKKLLEIHSRDHLLPKNKKFELLKEEEKI